MTASSPESGPQTAASRLAQLGLSLPAVPSPAAAYQPYAVTGDLIMTAGQLPLVDGVLPQKGRIGDGLTVDDGAQLARTAALNVLAVLAMAAESAGAGGLDDLDIVKVQVYVASAPGFNEQHLVANGASELLAAVLGERGTHARAAVGVSELPLASPVEVDAIARILPA